MSNEIVQEDTQEGRFLTFYLGKEIFGVEIRYVTEIIGIQKICELPEAPEFVKGIINLRGNIIPVVNMRLRLGKAEVDNTERTCIIVVDLPETKVGLIVDRVNEVAAISDELIVPPPDIQTGYQNRYIKGIGKLNGEIGLLLDCERL
ncbi:MAG: chemotaxis protein CheW, partial [Clostridia bacterium]|nr:chemotaxis protein CheW [Clostridia bacterium]